MFLGAISKILHALKEIIVNPVTSICIQYSKPQPQIPAKKNSLKVGFFVYFLFVQRREEESLENRGFAIPEYVGNGMQDYKRPRQYLP